MLDTIRDLTRTLLGLDVETLNAGQMALRAVLTFAVTVAIVRLGDKRLFGKGTAFDLVVAIMIGSVMSRAINGSAPFLPTLLGGVVLVGLHWLLAVLAFHTSWFGFLVKGEPVLLIQDGKIQRQGMRRGSVSTHDLAQALRLQGNQSDLAKVELAYLERSGDISVIPRKSEPRILDVSVEDGVQTVRIELA